MSAELLPCPFCGGTPLINEIPAHSHSLQFGDFKMPDHPGSWVVECGCGSGKIEATREAVIASWNRRAPAAAPAQAVSDARDAARDVLAERQRQINEEDWTPEHDDMHGFGELASAAACYALATTGIKARRYWPWHSSGWIKPASNRRNLVKAGALILAEIERLDRAALSKPAQADDGAAK